MSKKVPDNSIIESESINHVKTALNRTGHLRSYLGENDKTTSFDGFVEIHSEENFKKNTLQGSVKVQIKGVWKERLIDKKNIKYLIEYSDLRNFKQNGGVIFFVVYENYSNNKIYYNALMPLDIDEIVNKKRPQSKSVSVTFKEIPEDSQEVYSIFKEFIYNSDKQHNIDQKIIERFKKGEFINNRLTLGYGAFPTISEEAGIDYILKHPTYIYYHPEETEATLPITKVFISKIIHETDKTIEFEGELLYTKAIITHSQSGKNTIIKIGNNITIFDDEKRLSIQFSNMLSERLRDLRFITYAMANSNSASNEIIFTAKNGEIRTIQDIRDEIEHFSAVRKMLDFYGSNIDLDMNECDSNDWNRIADFVKCALYDEPIPYSIKGKPGIGIIKLGNIHLLIYCEESEKDNYYYISNLFNNSNLRMKYCDNEYKDIFIGSPYLWVLDHECLSNISNLNSAEVVRSVFQDYGEILIENAQVRDREINNLILEVLNAYDECCSDELLKMAEDIARKAVESCRTDAMTAFEINLYQILLRKDGQLSNDIKKRLAIIKRENAGNTMVELCCCILLHNDSEAEVIYNGLENEDRELFDTLPIKHIDK